MTTSLDILLKSIREDRDALVDTLVENDTLAFEAMRSIQGQIKSIDRIAQRIVELKVRNEEEDEDF